MDLVAYSDVARLLEENLNVEAVKAFQDQIQHFVDCGLKSLDLKRDDIVMATAGDNAILMFDDAATMHKFAQAVQFQTLTHNAALSIDSAKRWFRMGAATGAILVLPAEHRIVGSTIARAVRLEAAANIGQLVVDLPTFDALPDELKEIYGSIDIIKGKRNERFEGRRCNLIGVAKSDGQLIPNIADRPVTKFRTKTSGRKGLRDRSAAAVLSASHPVGGPWIMASTRRLAAIFAADVAGYSRLMGVDEERTHEHYKAHLGELFTPRIRQHGGRIVKSTGDGMLAEFPSAVEAVLCAVEVQCGMRLRNAGVAEDRQLTFRIGINVGDVIAEPEDIFGDGVNIAARLEGLAEPNGICVSHAVFEQVRDKLSYRFDDMGEQLVKNIARPLHVFVLRPETIASLPFTDATLIEPRAVAAGVVSGRPRPPRLSSVVLPFTNLSDDRDDQYFADAITDDVTTDLSRIPEMIVISSNTAFSYKDKRVDTRQIGRDLNVRYVFSGSVRRTRDRARVNVQLIDAETDAHVWAERFDYDAGELLALQDDITSRIAVALNLELVGAEAARPAEHPDALDYILRGRAALYNYRGSTPENLDEAIGLFRRALSADRMSIEAHALLALSLLARVLEQVATTPSSDIARAHELIDTVVSLSPRHPQVNFLKAQLLRAQNHFAAAIPEYAAAIALNRNAVIAIATLGLCKFFTGDLDEAIPAQERAIRLSPRDPRLPNWYWRIGMVHLLQSRTDEAILWLERARSANPRLPGPHAWLASAYALKGDLLRGVAELAEARRLSGDHRYISIAGHKSALPLPPKILDLAERTFYPGLRKAGALDY